MVNEHFFKSFIHSCKYIFYYICSIPATVLVAGGKMHAFGLLKDSCHCLACLFAQVEIFLYARCLGCSEGSVYKQAEHPLPVLFLQSNSN